MRLSSTSFSIILFLSEEITIDLHGSEVLLGFIQQLNPLEIL